MFRTLILSLLIALLPAPAMAHQGACHEEAVAAEAQQAEDNASAMGAMDHGHHGSVPVVEFHSCVGCVPPVSGLVQVDAPVALEGIQPSPAVLKALLSTAPEPDTPPPRALT